MNKQTARALIDARNAVKKKTQLLKSEFGQVDKLAKMYAPITKPLQDLVDKFKVCESKNVCPKLECPKLKCSKIEKTITPAKSRITSTPAKSVQLTSTPGKTGTESNFPTFSNISTIPEKSRTLTDTMVEDVLDFTPKPHVNSDEYFNDDTLSEFQKHLETPSFQNYLEDFDAPLPRIYVEEMIRDVEDNFDFNFGIRHDFYSAKFAIGDSVIDFKKADFILQLKNGATVQYAGTPGLYELLFKKHPVGFKPADRDQYIDIGLRTNLFRRNYSPNEQINGNNSIKYKEIIEPALRKKGLLQEKKVMKYTRVRQRLGSGFMQLNNKPVEFILYDDPNEIVERLRLLLASQAAGNNNHNNEIESIVEELRESGIIY